MLLWQFIGQIIFYHFFFPFTKKTRTLKACIFTFLDNKPFWIIERRHSSFVAIMRYPGTLVLTAEPRNGCTVQWLTNNRPVF